MLTELFSKIKESLVSVLPVTIIVAILYFTPLVNLTSRELFVFLGSAIFLIIGIGLFNLGADMSMTPMGEQIGSSLMKTRKILLILFSCAIMGVLITVAEPDLSVLANQVKGAISNSTLLIVTVGVGVGTFLAIAVAKIIFRKDLSALLMLFYMALFAVTSLLIVNGGSSMLAVSFDSGGVTTGPITVPFIMALGVGIAQTLGGRGAKENSFGLIALCSIGPIIVVLLLSLFSKGTINYTPESYEIATDLFKSITTNLFESLKEVVIALSLIVVFFVIIDIIFIKLPFKKLLQIGIGIIYTLVGLVVFLTSVKVGFMAVGYKIGLQIASYGAEWTIILGFILGMVVVLAEPAIHVLTQNVESITTGAITRKSMLIALCIGVGLSIGLSMIRVYFDFSLLYYIVPGYFISLTLSIFVPKVYTAIAFDSGGVASGPLTSSFILSMAIGACVAFYPTSPNKILDNAFGIVAMVALTPLITIQLLGFKAIVKNKVIEKSRMKKISDAEDEQIIEFN